MPVVSDSTATPERLLLRFREARDPNALGALFDLTAPGLLRVAISIAPDAASAENALQETFLAVLEAPERWDETRPLMPWLLGILHRQVGKVRRDGARTPEPLRLAPPLSSDDPANVAASREVMERARVAIDELPEPYRAVALMRWRHGLDPADIANIRGEAPGTTRSLLSRALEKLRKRLSGAAFALFGVPPTRGLSGVRRALMSNATTTATASTTVAVVGGVLVMKKIAAACVVVVLLLGGGTWWAMARHARSSAATKSHANSVAAATSAAEPRRKHAAESQPAGEVPPVDLDKCDRDLDLFGRVIDENGKPVPDAKVETVRYPSRGLGMSSAHWNEAEAGPASRTARDGTFAVRLARGDKFDLHVAAATFGDVVREDCQAGERVEITLRHGATLDVTTVDEAGAPVSSVRVRLTAGARTSATLKQPREVVTDAAGRAAITGLLPGPLTVYFLHARLGEPKWQRPIMPATGTLPLRVTMPTGRVLKGQVTDFDSGKPIAGASVDTWNHFRPVTTDADGRYTYFGWAYDRAMPVVIAAAGYGDVYRYDIPGDGEMNVALQVGDRVVGRLVREDGTPVEDAYVGVHGSREAVAQRPGSRQQPSDYSTALTSTDGRFDLGGLSRDIPHELIAFAPGLARTMLEFDRHFWTGATIDLGDVVMAASRSIEGLAVDFDGKPLPDATVSLVMGNGDTGRPGAYLRRQQRRTDDLGRFRFPELAAGTYSVGVKTWNAPQGPPARVELPADRDVLDARVKLGGSRSLTVLVVDDLDAPLADMLVVTDVTIDSKTKGLLAVSTGVDGRVTIRGVGAVPATTCVNVNRGDGAFAARFGPFPLDGKDVRVVVRRTVEIRGVVRGEDGTPLSSYITAALHRDGSDAGSGGSDETGAFALKVPLGEIVDLWARGTIPDAFGSKFTGFEGRLNGVKGPADDVAITLLPVKIVYDRALTVVVQDSTGMPVPGIQVSTLDSSKSWKVKTDSAGRARLDGLPNRLMVLAFSEGVAFEPQHPLDIAPKRVTLTPDGQEIVARFRPGASIRGRVVDARGHGVPDAYVAVATRDADYHQTRGDADGRFFTSGLPGLPHQLTVAGYVDGTLSQGVVEGVVPGDAEITITVAPKAK